MGLGRTAIPAGERFAVGVGGEVDAVVGEHGVAAFDIFEVAQDGACLLYTSPSPRDRTRSRMPSSA